MRAERRVARELSLPRAYSIHRLQVLAIGECHRGTCKHDELAGASGKRRIEVEIAHDARSTARDLADVGAQHDGEALGEDVSARELEEGRPRDVTEAVQGAVVPVHATPEIEARRE